MATTLPLATAGLKPLAYHVIKVANSRRCLIGALRRSVQGYRAAVRPRARMQQAMFLFHLIQCNRLTAF